MTEIEQKEAEIVEKICKIPLEKFKYNTERRFRVSFSCEINNITIKIIPTLMTIGLKNGSELIISTSNSCQFIFSDKISQLLETLYSKFKDEIVSMIEKEKQLEITQKLCDLSEISSKLNF